MICLSTPGTGTPGYTINTAGAVPFAIAPEIWNGEKWLSGADPGAVHKINRHSAQGRSAQAVITCRWPEGGELKSTCFLSGDGLQITLEGKGRIGLMLPAFQFDGRDWCTIENSGSDLSVRYENWICRFLLERGASIRDTLKTGRNRNGYYKIFRAEGKDSLSLRIAIFREGSEESRRHVLPTLQS